MWKNEITCIFLEITAALRNTGGGSTKRNRNNNSDHRLTICLRCGTNVRGNHHSFDTHACDGSNKNLGKYVECICILANAMVSNDGMRNILTSTPASHFASSSMTTPPPPPPPPPGFAPPSSPFMGSTPMGMHFATLFQQLPNLLNMLNANTNTNSSNNLILPRKVGSARFGSGMIPPPPGYDAELAEAVM